MHPWWWSPEFLDQQRKDRSFSERFWKVNHPDFSRWFSRLCWSETKWRDARVDLKIFMAWTYMGFTGVTHFTPHTWRRGLHLVDWGRFFFKIWSHVRCTVSTQRWTNISPRVKTNVCFWWISMLSWILRRPDIFYSIHADMPTRSTSCWDPSRIPPSAFLLVHNQHISLSCALTVRWCSISNSS